jgi:UDP-N-acetyl-D-mannosaminuronic acid dehydrogenase
MINEHIPYADLLLGSWKVNEYIPQFLVSHMLKRDRIHEKNVAVLGYTFKKDSDDVRDSLTPKLVRCLEREVPQKIRVCEPNLPEGAKLENGYQNESLASVLPDADMVFIAVDHSCFSEDLETIYRMCKKTAWFVDIWNLSGSGKIFYQNMEVAK